jgi:hypothetical protein
MRAFQTVHPSSRVQSTGVGIGVGRGLRWSWGKDIRTKTGHRKLLLLRYRA